VIQLFDNVLPHIQHEHVYTHVREKVPYRLGWKDRRDSKELYIHSRLELDDVNELGILQIIDNTPEIKKYVKPTLFDFAVVNLDTIGSVHHSHTHKESDVFLLYLNKDWRQEWGGETVFFDRETGEDIEFACTPKGNRAVWFDGEIPHSIRAPVVNEWRFSISLFFRKET
jgi:hypothetical protein